MGIGPTSSAWEADALPLSYTRRVIDKDQSYQGFTLRCRGEKLLAEKFLCAPCAHSAPLTRRGSQLDNVRRLACRGKWKGAQRLCGDQPRLGKV